MTNSQYDKCSAIIHTASVAAGGVGAGLAQLPCSDNALITPIQLTMTISLGQVFNLDIDESAAKATVASMAGATIGRAISQCFVGWIPGIGNAINASTAAAVTEALGWLIAEDFGKREQRQKIEKFQRNLQCIRMVLNLTPEELGNMLNVSRQTVMSLESHKTEMTFVQYIAFKVVLRQVFEKMPQSTKDTISNTTLLRDYSTQDEIAALDKALSLDDID